MDLEARVRELVDAVAHGKAEPFLAPRLFVEVDDRPVTRDEAVAWLRSAKGTRPAVTQLAVKRNLVFCDGDWPGVGAGVVVLAFDQDGLVTGVTARRR